MKLCQSIFARLKKVDILEELHLFISKGGLFALAIILILFALFGNPAEECLVTVVDGYVAVSVGLAVFLEFFEGVFPGCAHSVPYESNIVEHVDTLLGDVAWLNA